MPSVGSTSGGKVRRSFCSLRSRAQRSAGRKLDMRLSTRVPTTAQLRNLEAAWIKACHSDWGLVLMEIAGRHAAEQSVSIWQEGAGDVVVLCGRGNNGGDGLVVARYLKL